MRKLALLAAVLGFALAAPATVRAQSLLKYGVAVTGGSFGGTVAGKQVSHGIDKALAASAKSLEGTPEMKPAIMPAAPEHPQASGAPRGVLPPLIGRKVVRPPARLTVALPPYLPEIPTALRTVIAPPIQTPSLPSAVDVAGRIGEVGAGSSRRQVLSQLGTPASRVSIPGNAGLEEILYYTAGGNMIGSVRMVNGLVTRVVVNNR